MQFKKKRIRVSLSIGIEDWLLISRFGDQGVDVEGKIQDHFDQWIQTLREPEEALAEAVDPETGEFDAMVLSVIDRNQCDVSVADLWADFSNRVNSAGEKWVQKISPERAYIRIAKMLVRRGWVKYRTPPSYPGGRMWRYRFPQTLLLADEFLATSREAMTYPALEVARISDAIDQIEGESLSIADVLDKMEVPPLDQTQIMQNKVARILRTKGFGKFRGDADSIGRRPWRYRKLVIGAAPAADR